MARRVVWVPKTPSVQGYAPWLDDDRKIVDRKIVGGIEAKPQGTTLSGMEWQ